MFSSKMKKALIRGAFLVSPLILTLPTWAGSTFSLAYEDKNLEPFFSSIEKRLPHQLKQKISKTIVVKFVEMDGSLLQSLSEACEKRKLQKNPSKSQQTLAGRVSRPNFFSKFDTIFLNRELLEEIKKGESKSNRSCFHGNIYRFAQATLIHELVHIYDHNTKHSAGGTKGPSDDKMFLSLIHNSRKKDWPLLRRTSPDPYEFENKFESFATNFEYFLLDDEYACRRPGLYNFYSHHFNFEPQTNCTIPSQVYFSDSGEPIQLEQSRLHSIRLIIADESERIQGQWGHVYLHLVFCSPSRLQISSKCLTDFEHHIVVDFTAKINHSQINILTGVFGGYFTSLNILPFSKIKTEANYRDLRNLYSLPLYFNQSQVEDLLNRIIEVYWTYSSEYFFVANNCAHEITRLILSALPDSHRAHDEESEMYAILTPYTLYKALFFSGLTTSSLDDSEVVKFDSHEVILAQSFHNLLESRHSSLHTFKDYLNSRLQSRKDLLHDIQRTSSADKMKLLLASMLVIEKQILESLKKSVMDDAYEQYGRNVDFSTLVAPQDWFQVANFTNSDYKYGIPLEGELKPLDAIKQMWKKTDEPRTKYLTQIWQKKDNNLLDETQEFYNELLESFF